MSTDETTTLSRRGVLRTAAWSVPAVVVATAAPAFATSVKLPPEYPLCAVPTACKLPGKGHNTKDYEIGLVVYPGVHISQVLVDGKAAVKKDGRWFIGGFKDSRSLRTVRVVASDGAFWEGMVKFLPKDCKKKGK